MSIRAASSNNFKAGSLGLSAINIELEHSVLLDAQKLFLSLSPENSIKRLEGTNRDKPFFFQNCNIIGHGSNFVI